MRIAVTSTGPSLDAALDPRFGRCSYFVFVETDDMSFNAVENPNLALGGGAGIQSGQLVSQKGAQLILTGNLGPNAFQTLSAAEIDVITGCSGTVAEAVAQYKAGKLQAASQANVADHAGMGGGMGGGGGRGMGGGGGRGMGGGGGRGMGGGGGRGMGGGGGRGMGGGGGRGMGGGGGRGMGGGGDRGMGQGTQSLPGQSAPAQPLLIAVVDVDQCDSCGLCEEACPEGAISITDVACVDGARCNGCALCLPACPPGALSLHKA